MNNCQDCGKPIPEGKTLCSNCELKNNPLYPPSSQKCPCKGTGLIPPTSELKKGGHQAYCPTHRCKRDWPQLQRGGRIEYIELRY